MTQDAEDTGEPVEDPPGDPAPSTAGGPAPSDPAGQADAVDGPATPPVAAAAPMARRPRASLLTWGTVALVLVIVVILVVVKITGTTAVSTSSAPSAPAAAPTAVVQAVTAIPASVYDTVGVTSSVAAVTPPTLLHGQPSLERDGKAAVVFVGDEFCPYCAAERWALVAALSRFGTFTGLDAIQSGTNEAFPSTPTFAFVGTRYSSKYISAQLIEHYSDQKDSAGTGYAVLEPIPSAVRALMTKYDKATAGGLVPFVDIGNQAVVAGGNFSPSIFQQLSNTEIAAALKDAKDPAAQAIVATANYLSAVICQADDQQPTKVCLSTGVAAADAALSLST